MHLFRLADGELLKSWGSKGDGPGEFREAPTSVALVGNTVYAVDLNQQQLEVFDVTNDSVETARMDALGLTLPAYVSRLERVGSVLLLRPMDPMGRRASVVAWRSQEGVLGHSGELRAAASVDPLGRSAPVSGSPALRLGCPLGLHILGRCLLPW